MASNLKRGALRLATSPRQDEFRQVALASMADRVASDRLDYYGRIEDYARKIRGTTDVDAIITILDEALTQTRALHTDDEVAQARAQVVNAERRIEQLKVELELISKLVHEDQLSGALNRRGLDDAIERETARAVRNGTPLCIALIDIDDFKKVNDTYGHQVGDIVLVHLVAIIKETIRTHDLIGRYGGEEFMVLLPDSSIDEAVAVTSRLQRELAAKPLAWGNNVLRVTFSAGVAAHAAGEPNDRFIRRADQALYEAKHAGKDCVIVAS